MNPRPLPVSPPAASLGCSRGMGLRQEEHGRGRLAQGPKPAQGALDMPVWLGAPGCLCPLLTSSSWGCRLLRLPGSHSCHLPASGWVTGYRGWAAVLPPAVGAPRVGSVLRCSQPPASPRPSAPRWSQSRRGSVFPTGSELSWPQARASTKKAKHVCIPASPGNWLTTAGRLRVGPPLIPRCLSSAPLRAPRSPPTLPASGIRTLSRLMEMLRDFRGHGRPHCKTLSPT